MFAPVSATRTSRPARPPGRSGTRVIRTSRRPTSVSWRRATAASSPGSTLPPERTATVVAVLGRASPARRSARRRRRRRRPRRRAWRAPSAPPSPRRVSSSPTTTMSSACSTSSASVSSPGRLTAMPSAIVERRRGATARRVERLRVRRARRDLHADHLDVGPRRLDRDRDPGAQPAAADRDDDLREVRHVLEQLEPERSPGRRRCRVVERVHERHPGLVARACAIGQARRRPSRRRCSPSRPALAPPRPWRSARRRARTPRTGPRVRAPPRRGSARGCRRCRDDALRAAVAERRQLVGAPRILNEPVRCRFSALSTTTPPTRSEIVRDDSTGVRRAIASTAGRAAATSSAVTSAISRARRGPRRSRPARPAAAPRRRSCCAPAARR